MAEYQKHIREIHHELSTLAIRWARGARVDPAHAQATRRAAILANHQHYFDNIPVYRKLAEQADVEREADFDLIVREMMSTDHIFKSYPQALLDEGDYAGMNNWLRQVFDREVTADVAGVDTIDEWLHRLEAAQVHTVFSSGTSGNMSFVPRDPYTWRLLADISTTYVPLFQMRQGIASPLERVAARTASRVMAPEKFSRFFQEKGLRGFDGFFLSFAGGTQGTQVVGQVLADMTRKATFLFDIELSATAVRALTRGPSSDQEQQLTDQFLDVTVHRRQENYQRVWEAMRRSTEQRQRAVVFGAPFMVKEFCDWVVAQGKQLELRPGSILFHGGGWKTFEGDRIDEQALLELVGRATGITPAHVSEGYSMTEAQVVFPRCSAGRFHIPPITETVVFDEALEPLAEDEAYGALGFLDPFAVSYPGFMITGDNVRRHADRCECGIHGLTITDIGRVPGREVKGCGGIMAAMQG